MTNPLSRLKSIYAKDGTLADADEILLDYVEPNSLIDSGSLFFAALEYHKRYQKISCTAMPILIEVIEKQREVLEGIQCWDYPAKYKGMAAHQIDWAIFKSTEALAETNKLIERIGE